MSKQRSGVGFQGVIQGCNAITSPVLSFAPLGRLPLQLPVFDPTGFQPTPRDFQMVVAPDFDPWSIQSCRREKALSQNPGQTFSSISRQ